MRFSEIVMHDNLTHRKEFRCYKNYFQGFIVATRRCRCWAPSWMGLPNSLPSKVIQIHLFVATSARHDELTGSYRHAVAILLTLHVLTCVHALHQQAGRRRIPMLPLRSDCSSGISMGKAFYLPLIRRAQ